MPQPNRVQALRSKLGGQDPLRQKLNSAKDPRAMGGTLPPDVAQHLSAQKNQLGEAPMPGAQNVYQGIPGFKPGLVKQSAQAKKELSSLQALASDDPAHLAEMGVTPDLNRLEALKAKVATLQPIAQQVRQARVNAGVPVQSGTLTPQRDPGFTRVPNQGNQRLNPYNPRRRPRRSKADDNAQSPPTPYGF